MRLLQRIFLILFKSHFLSRNPNSFAIFKCSFDLLLKIVKTSNFVDFVACMDENDEKRIENLSFVAEPSDSTDEEFLRQNVFESTARLSTGSFISSNTQTYRTRDSSDKSVSEDLDSAYASVVYIGSQIGRFSVCVIFYTSSDDSIGSSVPNSRRESIGNDSVFDS